MLLQNVFGYRSHMTLIVPIYILGWFEKPQADPLDAHKNKTICLIKNFIIIKMPLEFDILVYKASDSKIQRKNGTFSFLDFLIVKLF